MELFTRLLGRISMAKKGLPMKALTNKQRRIPQFLRSIIVRWTETKGCHV